MAIPHMPACRGAAAVTQRHSGAAGACQLVRDETMQTADSLRSRVRGLRHRDSGRSGRVSEVSDTLVVQIEDTLRHPKGPQPYKQAHQNAPRLLPAALVPSKYCKDCSKQRHVRSPSPTTTSSSSRTLPPLPMRILM